MKCEQFLAALNDQLDGEIRSALCQALREHLADCKACRIVIDNIRQTITLYRAGQALPLPAGLHQRLRAIVAQRWAVRFPPADLAALTRSNSTPSCLGEIRREKNHN